MSRVTCIVWQPGWHRGVKLVGNQASELFRFYQFSSGVKYILAEMTVVALMTLLDQRIVELIQEYVDKRLVIHWETVYGVKFIYRTKHYPTHGGNPTGGFVHVNQERKLSWYEWSFS